MDGLEVSRAARRRVQIAQSLPTVPPAEAAAVSVALDALPDPALLTAEERAAALTASQEQINRLTAYQHRLALEADAQGDSRILHAGTTGTLIAVATNQDPSAGSALLKRAHELRDLPCISEAFRGGRISVRHVAAVVADHRRIDRMAGMEAEVATLAEIVEPAELRRILKQLVDRSGLDDDHEKLREKRGLSLSQLPNGNYRIDGILDPITGESLADALNARMDAPTPQDRRTVTQRRADAMADVVAAAGTHTGRLGVSGVSVLVDLKDLGHGQLADGTVLGDRLTELLTCDPLLNVIVGTKTRDVFVPLAVGRVKRFATVAQWLALIARDRGCIRCGKHPRHCHAHHIIGWAQGGLTDLENLALLCSRCHHDLHFGHYTIVMQDGVPQITPANKAPPVSARREPALSH